MSNFTGTSANDTLTGTASNDNLDGGAGADTMSGLAGDDVYMVDSVLDVVIEGANQGTDRVNATISTTLGANIEDLWLVGSAVTSGIGNTLNNVMWGNATDNSLTGLAGNDVLDGGAGADTMIGGTGDDTYWVDNAGDVVTELAGEGTDTVNSNLASYGLGSTVENLTLITGAGNINGTGNALDNTLVGNDGNNVLTGGAGNDSLDGSSGADTLIGGTGDDNHRVDDAGDVVTENAGEGTDTVTTLLANYTLSANVENLTLFTNYASTTNLNGTGNAVANTLRGNSGDNVLSGNGGDDTLVGGNGNDTLTGGTGNDEFYFSTDDTGIDTITDLTSGDHIKVCGGIFLTGDVTTGNGSALMSGEVQLVTAGGQSTLYVGTNDTIGSDLTILLNGTYATGDFLLSGFDISYDTNHAPATGAAIADQLVSAGSAFGFQVPAGAFNDPDHDALTYSIDVFDEDWFNISTPSWMHFNSATGLFSGTPATGDSGSLIVMITATDTHGAVGINMFNLTVGQAAAVVVVPPVVIDTTPPTATISDNVVGTATGAVTYALNFSETVTGLSAEDFTISNGTVSSTTGSDKNYTVVVTPGVNTEGTMSLSLKAGGVHDLAGNLNAAVAADSQLVDTRAATVSSFSPNNEEHGIKIADNIVFTFSEAIARGTGNILLKTSAGLLVGSYDVATSTNLSISGSTLTINPSSDLSYNTVYKVEFGTGTIHDAAGNNFKGTSSYNLMTAEQKTDHLKNTKQFFSHEGDDTIAGSTGIDSVVFSGQKSDYKLTKTASGWSVSSDSDGKDTLSGVERLSFADGNIALDIEGNAGQAYRLYQAAFNRAPDLGGLGYQMKALDDGLSLAAESQNFINSPEFAQKYGNLSNQQFITQLYANVLHREPDAGGLAYYVNRLDAKAVSQAEVLCGFSESPENQAALIGVMENGFAYTPYLG